MDDNYTRNGSNNANGFQIDRYFLDTCVVHTSVHIQNRVMLRNNNEKTPTNYGKEAQTTTSTSR
jgi:hypothetical protein